MLDPFDVPCGQSLRAIKSAGQPVSASHRIGPWFEPSSLEPHCCGSKRDAAAQWADSATAVRRAVATAGAVGALPQPFVVLLRDLAFFLAAGLALAAGAEAATAAGASCRKGHWVPNRQLPCG